MTYALGLGQGRPRPAAMLAFSGFIPTVDGFELDLSPPLPPIAIGHGMYDSVIGVEWSRKAHELLPDAVYRESPLAHTIDPRFLRDLVLSSTKLSAQDELRQHARGRNDVERALPIGERDPHRSLALTRSRSASETPAARR